MAIRFIIDNKLREERQTVAEILELTKKQSYSSKEAVHLTRFIEACFSIVEEKQTSVVRQQRKREIQRLMEDRKRQRKEEEKVRKKELEEEAPNPESELPELEAPAPLEAPLHQASFLEEEISSEDIPLPHPDHREYILKLYGAPVGIVVDKNDQGAFVYHVVEPRVDPNIIAKAKSLYGRELEKDNSLFDNITFMAKVAEKAARKARQSFSPLLVPNVRYYLERDILGAKKFDTFLYDEKVKAIICDGAGKLIKLEYADLGLMESNVMIESNEEINQLFKRIAAATGKTLDTNHPILDVTFQGLRFEGIMGIGGENSRLTIRRLEL